MACCLERLLPALPVRPWPVAVRKSFHVVRLSLSPFRPLALKPSSSSTHSSAGSPSLSSSCWGTHHDFLQLLLGLINSGHVREGDRRIGLQVRRPLPPAGRARRQLDREAAQRRHQQSAIEGVNLCAQRASARHECVPRSRGGLLRTARRGVVSSSVPRRAYTCMHGIAMCR